MTQEPSNLSDFRTLTLEERDALIARYFRDNGSEQLLVRPDDHTLEMIPVEWGTYSVRVRNCLQSLPRSYRLLDWSTLQGDIGRAERQEEYFETGKCSPHTIRSRPAGPNPSLTIAALADRFADPIIQLKGAEE